MKKMFVQYPGLRSSTRARRNKQGQISYKDPCVDEKGNTACDHCRVFVISDRFLGNESQLKYTGSLKKFPYVIIADTVGCNLRCWFCYSHHYWSLEKAAKTGCKPLLLSSEELAEQLYCKIRKIKSLEGQMERKPFMRIRISGGEPIFATAQLVQPYTSCKEVDYEVGIEYWLDFFKSLDSVIAKLASNKDLYVVKETEWSAETSPWPAFIADSPSRLNIRFDTNGIGFKDKAIANSLVEGIYDLHKKGRLNNIKIWVDYSFKGATPSEYFWSQKAKLPTMLENNPTEFNLHDHPQFTGLANLHEKISELSGQDKAFSDCINITVEKGLNHDRDHRIFVYNQDAFDWDAFEKKAGITFSPVKNDMCVVYTYGGGPWGLFKSGRALLHRYFNQGATITLNSDSSQISVNSSSPDGVNKALNFMATHHAEQNYFGVLGLEKMPPGMKLPGATLLKPLRIGKESRVRASVMGWVLSGPITNWILALSQNIWGAGPRHQTEWENNLKEGQLVFFYITRPISGIIGYGKITKKEIGEGPLWPDEIEINRVKYPYRWYFNPIFVLPQEDWPTKAISLKGTDIIFFGGMNAIGNKAQLNKMTSLIKEHWDKDLLDD